MGSSSSQTRYRYGGRLKDTGFNEVKGGGQLLLEMPGFQRTNRSQGLTDADVAMLRSLCGFNENKKEVEVWRRKKNSVPDKGVTKTLRAGKWVELPSRELLPGDIIELVADQQCIPADVLLFQGELTVDESSMIGEPVPQTFSGTDDGTLVLSGGDIVTGEGLAEVCATGDFSRLGCIATRLPLDGYI